MRDTAERNPFIGREEFLMNRIVRRNNAAPPWIDLQTGTQYCNDLDVIQL